MRELNYGCVFIVYPYTVCLIWQKEILNPYQHLSLAIWMLIFLPSCNRVKNTLQNQNTGINLGLLTATLSPSHLLVEDDLPWEFDSLLQKVSQEMQIDLDALEKDKEDEKGNDAPIKNRAMKKI